jgi:carbamoyl-phosphate synthase large subunit
MTDIKNKILIAGAGGAPSEGVVNSLLQSKKQEMIIGMGADLFDLVLSNAHKKYFVPYCYEDNYKKELIKILQKEKPDLIHFQNDLEIFQASLFRDEIHNCGTKTFMPEHSVIDTCVNKYKSYLKFKDASIKVPVNLMINDEADLKKAFTELGDDEGKIWIRASSIGGGGKGSIATNDYEMARAWINRHNGWSDFIAAQMLTDKTVTFLSIWFEGDLIVAQTRKRSGWIHGNRAPSGVTGVTKVGETYSNLQIDEIAISAIKAVSDKPHGIFGVDMAYDKNGIANPTEINISRFFTTILFFTQAGLNMPEIFKDIALYNEFPKLQKKINPLPDGLLWARGMDTKPKLITKEEIKKEVIVL